MTERKYEPEMLITRIPYLIGTAIVAGFMATIISLIPKAGAEVALVMAGTPIWMIIALAIGIGGTVGMAFPGMQLPNAIIWPGFFMTWPMGLGSLLLYGTLVYPVFPWVPIWVLVPVGVLLTAISGIALGNVVEYCDMNASKWNFTNWLNWRWSWAGISLTALTIVEGIGLGLVVRHAPAMVYGVLALATAVKLLACFAAPWRYHAPQPMGC